MAIETEDLAPPDWMSETQRASWRLVIANLTSAQARGLDVQTLATWVVAEEQHRTAAIAQGRVDKSNALPLLTKGKGDNGRVTVSPYLALIASGAEQMRRAAAALGFRPVARVIAGPAAEQTEELHRPDADLEPAPAPTGNKKELARALGTSIVSLNKWLDRFGDEVPCVSRGTHGQAYVFDLPSTVEFFRVKREAEAERQAERDDMLAQLALPFLDTVTDQPPGLPLKDQLLALEVGRKKREEAERLKTLVPFAEMRDAMAEAFANLGRRMHQRLTQGCRECGLPDDVTRRLVAIQADAQREFVDEVRQRAKLPDAA